MELMEGGVDYSGTTFTLCFILNLAFFQNLRRGNNKYNTMIQDVLEIRQFVLLISTTRNQSYADHCCME
jgi:hypothetical protein